MSELLQNSSRDVYEEELDVHFQDGTQRTCSPKETLSYIESRLPLCGITRAADITKLDNIGIPTYCAIRPTAKILQVSNGKGSTNESAKVSALMESVELFHVENSEPYKLQYKAAVEFSENELILDHRSLPSFSNAVYYTDKLKINWCNALNVTSGETVWIPASTIFFDQQQSIHRATTNGLASGNHLIEASLHALYELIERDSASRISVNGLIKLKGKTEVVDIASVEDPIVSNQLKKMGADSKVLLIYIKSPINVYTFWSVLLNRSAMNSLSSLNIGWGCHRDKSVAASRAITEAAQSRLTSIHGAREDIMVKAGYQNSNIHKSQAYVFMDSLEPTIKWAKLPKHQQSTSNNLSEDWSYLLSELTRCGYKDIYQFDLTRSDIDIPVVKMLVPNLKFNQKLF